MLKVISYLNIALAISYFLLYLLNSTSYAMAGVFVIIAFSGFVIRNLEKEQAFTMIHCLLGLPGLAFAGFLSVWTFNIISSSLEHNYFGNSWFYIFLSTCLVIGIVAQFTSLFRR